MNKVKVGRLFLQFSSVNSNFESKNTHKTWNSSTRCYSTMYVYILSFVFPTDQTLDCAAVFLVALVDISKYLLAAAFNWSSRYLIRPAFFVLPTEQLAKQHWLWENSQIRSTRRSIRTILSMSRSCMIHFEIFYWWFDDRIEYPMQYAMQGVIENSAICTHIFCSDLHPH